MNYSELEIWFVTGAQLLYGGDAVTAVDAHSSEMVRGLNESGQLPLKIVYRGTVNSPAETAAALGAANSDSRCAGVLRGCTRSRPPRCGSRDCRITANPCSTSTRS